MRTLSQPPASAPATTLSHPIRLSDILSPRTPLTGITTSTADEHHPVEVEVEIVDDPPMSGWSDSTLSTPAPTPLSSAFPISRLSGRASLERGPEARATARRDADAGADALGDASHYGDAPSAPVKLRLELPPAVKFRTRLSRLASSSPLDGVLDIGRTPPNTASAGEGRELSMREGETRASRTSFSISSWARARSRPSADLPDTSSSSYPPQDVSPGSATTKSPLKWLRRVSGSPASPSPPSTTTRGFWGLPSPLQRIRTPRTASKDAVQLKRTWTIQLDKVHGQVVLSPYAGTAALKSPRPLPTPISADHDGANAAGGEGTGPADMSPMSPLPPLRTPKTPLSASTHSVSRPGEGTYRVSVETASSAGVVLLMRDESGVLLARLSLGQDGDRVELLSPEERQQHSDEPEGGTRNEYEHESSADAPTQQIPLETLNGSGVDSLRLYAPRGTYTWRTTPGLALCHSPSRTTTAKISWRPLGRTRLTVIGYEDDQPMTHLLLVSAAKVWLDRQADRDFRL